MFARAILVALLLAFPLRAGDIPLSDRPLAPIPDVRNIDASASSDAVLVALGTDSGVYVQRIGFDGALLDSTVTFIGSGSVVRTAWDGKRWVVVGGGWDSPFWVTYVAPSGAVQETHAINYRFNQYDASPLILVGDRVLFTNRPRSHTLELLELTPSGTVAPLRTIISQFQVARPVGLEGEPGILYLSSPGTFSLENQAGLKREFTVESAPSLETLDFFPSRAGGGLLVWHDHGWRGLIVRPDATASAPFPIGPPRQPTEGTYPAFKATARDGGWDALLDAAGATYLASISERGNVVVTPLADTVHYHHQILSSAGAHILIASGASYGAGFRFRRVVGGELEDPVAAGFGEAAQFRVRTAAGAGIDVAVWEEQSAIDVVLKATRIDAAGAPLDGAGLLISDSGAYRSDPELNPQFDVTFDGERFVVVWIECAYLQYVGKTCSIWSRTILPDGSVSIPLALAERRRAEGVAIAGAGGGRSAVAWLAWEAERAPLELLPMERGRRGIPVAISRGDNVLRVPLLAAAKDRYLAVFNSVDIPFPNDIRLTGSHGHMFALDGAELNGPRQFGAANELLFDNESDGRSFFVVSGDDLLIFDRDFATLARRTIARGGDLSIAGRELRIDHSFEGPAVRGTYSLSGDLLRLEPLPVHVGETRADVLSNDRILVRVPSHPDRFYVRSLRDSSLPVADLAVEVVGARLVPWGPPHWDHSFVRFRIEHRGGAPVTRLHVWSEETYHSFIDAVVDGEEPRVMHPSFPFVVERELREGDSLEVELRFGWGIYPAVNPPLWIAGDAVDPFPLNNGARFERPLRIRSRPVVRP